MKQRHCLYLAVLLSLLSGRTFSTENSLEATLFEKECAENLAGARRLFVQLTAHQGVKNLDSILRPLNDLEVAIDRGYNRAQLYYHVHPEETVREAAGKCEQDFNELVTEITLSRPLYDAVSAVDSSEAGPAGRRYHENTLEDFQRSGVDRDEKTRLRIAEIREALVKLGQEFSKNISSDARKIELDSKAALSGLPEDFIDSHKPGKDGKIVVTTDYPDYFPFMKFAERDDLRLALYTQFRNRGYPANEAVLNKILELRYELARILGYAHYADYITEDKMIGDAASVQDFIDRISKIADKRAGLDYQTLLERLKKTEPNATRVGDWQKTWLQEQVRRETYQLDSREVRQYFDYAKVRDGIFQLMTTLFGIRITEWETDTWHDSVEAYEVHDNGKLLARFYLDMHPREGKYKHAAHFPIQVGLKDRQLPVSALICNFPGGKEGSSLMSHNQVETFLHEFGHLIHHFFASGHDWAAFSGVATEWDFVEAPSQMLEEWIWDAGTLRLFATNDKGESIPDALIEKMNASRYFSKGLWAKNQMFYAATSLNYYNRDPASFELQPMMVKMQGKYSPWDYVDDTHFFASFGHLDGYSAMYYTYMWSLVIANDLFSRFDKEGMHNRKVAMDYRNRVLAPGGSEDAADLVEDFLGRPYNFEAFKRELEKGLK